MTNVQKLIDAPCGYGSLAVEFLQVFYIFAMENIEKRLLLVSVYFGINFSSVDFRRTFNKC